MIVDRSTILRHIETSVDVDEWAVVKVKENFNKLERIEAIVNAWNNDASHSFEDMCKINGILKE